MDIGRSAERRTTLVAALMQPDPPEPATSTRADVVDDPIFDLLQALTSSLEALDAYREYAVTGSDPIFGTLIESERHQATLLLGALRARLRTDGSAPG